MKCQKKAKGYNNLNNTYLLCFLIIAFLVFVQFIIYGKTFIYYTDGYFQHYSFLVYIKQVLDDFIAGHGFELWSWSSGLGADMIGNYALVLCDPFSYIAFLFPVKYFDVGITISVIIRMLVAGFVVLCFLKYIDKTDFQSLIGGLGYAFSMWSVILIGHPFFLTAYIIFPLIIFGIEKIERERSPQIFVLAVTFSLMTSLYFSYMSAIMSVVYVILKYFFDCEKKGIRIFLKKMIQYVLYTMIAALIASPIMIPILYTLLNANKSSGVEINILPTLKECLLFIPSFITGCDVRSNYTYSMVSVFFLALLPCVIMRYQKKENKLPIIMFTISVLMLLIPACGSVMNGFSYSAGRWCYSLTFFLVFATITSVDFEDFQEPAYRNKYAKLVLFELVVFLFCILCGKIIFNVISEVYVIIGLINIFFLLIFAVLFVNPLWWSNRSRVYIGFFIVSTALPYMIYFSPNVTNRIDAYMNIGSSYERYNESVQRVILEIEDEDFWRVDQMEWSGPHGNISSPKVFANDNLFFNTRGLYTYISTIDKKHSDFNKLLLNNGGVTLRTIVRSNDQRSRLDFLQGVKYFIGDDAQSKTISSEYAGYIYEYFETIDGINVLKNKYNTSLGYVYDKIIYYEDFVSQDALDMEQLLMQAAVVDSEQQSLAKVATSDSLPIHTKELEYHFVDGHAIVDQNNTNTIHVKSGKQTLIIELDDIAQNCELYVEFINLKRKPSSFEELLTSIENNDTTIDKREKINKNRFIMSNPTYNAYGDFIINLEKNNILKQIVNAMGENQAFVDSNDYLVNMGYYDVVDGQIELYFSNTGEYKFDSLRVYAVPQDDFDEQADKLSDARYEVKTIHDNYLSGTVDTNHDGVLYLSILYNPGWKVYIDGEETETFITNVAFTGVNITKGKHVVELKYRPVFFEYCLVACGFGLVILTVIMIKKRKGKSNEKSISGNTII